MNTTDEHKYTEITFYRVTTTLSHRESEAAAFRPAWCSAGVLAGVFSNIASILNAAGTAALRCCRHVVSDAVDNSDVGDPALALPAWGTGGVACRPRLVAARHSGCGIRRAIIAAQLNA